MFLMLWIVFLIPIATLIFKGKQVLLNVVALSLIL